MDFWFLKSTLMKDSTTLNINANIFLLKIM